MDYEDEFFEDGGDIYCEEVVDEMLEDDELTAKENAFMRGYNER